MSARSEEGAEFRSTTQIHAPRGMGRPPIPSGPNYGEKLYQRGIKHREEREIILREARSEQLRNEID